MSESHHPELDHDRKREAAVIRSDENCFGTWTGSEDWPNPERRKSMRLTSSKPKLSMPKDEGLRDTLDSIQTSMKGIAYVTDHHIFKGKTGNVEVQHGVLYDGDPLYDQKQLSYAIQKAYRAGKQAEQPANPWPLFLIAAICITALMAITAMVVWK